MAIVFDSDAGTVTGLSVGGLPDGIVDSGTLATNSVDSAELIDGAVDASHLASGVGFDPDGTQVFNESGADVDFRVESDDNANMLFVDGGEDRVGIGTGTPQGFVEINNNDVSGTALYVTGGENDLDPAGGYTGIAFGYGGAANYNKGGIFWEFTNAAADGKLHLATKTGTATTVTKDDAKLTVLQSGKVGIGTSAPVALLSLGGDINAGQGDPEACSGIAFQTSSHDDQFQIKTVGGSNNDQRGLLFLQNGSERMRMIGSGGLTFNGDTATANALDDYEEGTWTPVVKNTADSAVTYSNSGAYYTKIGRVVHCDLKVDYQGTDNIKSITLPFTSLVGVKRAGSQVTYNMPLTNYSVGIMVGSSSNVLELWQMRNNATSYFYWAVDNASETILHITYMTA